MPDMQCPLPPRLFLFILLLPVTVMAESNLLPLWNPGVPATLWQPAGHLTTATLDPAGGEACYIADRGDQIGQANSPPIEVSPEEWYLVSLRIMIDPDLPGTAVIDTLHMTGDGLLRGGSKPIATVRDSGCVRVSRILQPRQGARFMKIRVMPAAGDPEAHGACWVAEVVVKPYADVTDDDLGLTRAAPATSPTPPFCPPSSVAVAAAAGLDFEDLEGWSVTFSDQMDSTSLSLSTDQACLGDFVARLQYKSASPGQSVVLSPPVPIEIKEPFDSVTLWIFQHFYGFVTANVPWEIGPTPRVLIEDADGRRHNLQLSRVTWQNWSVARGKLPELVPTPARITGIAFDNLPASHDVSGTSAERVLTPKTFYIDALQCSRESSQELDLEISESPLADRAATFRPLPSGSKLSASVYQEGDTFVLEVVSAHEAWRYEYRPRTGSTADLTVNGIEPLADRGVEFEIDGKAYLMTDPAIQWELQTARINGDQVVALWTYAAGETGGTLEYRFSVEDASLSLQISSTDRHVRRFVRGEVGADTVQGIFVPFLNWSGWWQDFTVDLVDNEFFLSRFNDVYRSDCSTIRFDGTHAASEYNSRTDGVRNAFRDRWLITPSRTFENVLPHIRHPVNEAANRFSSYLYARDFIPYRSAADREGGLRYLQLCRRYGINHLMIKLTHLSTDKEEWGLLPAMNVYDHVPRSTEGGIEAFQDYIRDIQGLGYKVLLYTDYHQFDPLAEFWNPDHAVQRSDGNWVDSWRHCYRLSPLAAPAIAEDMTRRITETLGIDGTYLDESGSFPWGAITDHDARKPGAALARVAYQAQLGIPATEQRIHGGPSYGEGSAQWLWAGFLSGAYGQTYWPSWDHETAWLVDFELRKVHPLMTNLSMGYAFSRYGGLPEDDPQWALDRWHAAAMAFGRAGAFKVPFETKADWEAMREPRWIWREKKRIFQEYFLFQSLQEAYALVRPREIVYESGGQWLSAGDALRDGTLKDNHIRVTYENGLELFVNGSLDTEDTWTIQVHKTDLVLPQNGFVFLKEELTGFGARIDGHRVDYVDGFRYLYADARGEPAQFPHLRTSGCVVIRKDVPGIWDVILVSGDEVTLDAGWLWQNGLGFEQIEAMDEEENVMWGANASVVDGEITLTADDDVTSYRIPMRASF